MISLPFALTDWQSWFLVTVISLTLIVIMIGRNWRLINIKKTNWRTSIFSDSKSGTYLLPLKAAVRKAEQINVGDRVQVFLKIG